MPPTRLGMRLEQEFQSELIETLVGPWGCAGGEAQIPVVRRTADGIGERIVRDC
jgi:hypothetical protein